MAGREGGGSGGIMHHGDECEWVQRREEGKKREDRKMKISCKNSHWVRGFRVQVSFLWYFTNTGYSAGYGRFRDSKMCLQRMHVVTVKRHSGGTSFKRNTDLYKEDLSTQIRRKF